jgi:hypothetical protein
VAASVPAVAAGGKVVEAVTVKLATRYHLLPITLSRLPLLERWRSRRLEPGNQLPDSGSP